MKSNASKKSKDQGAANSNLFLQLGILLALFLVFQLLQLRVVQDVATLPPATNPEDEPEMYVIPQVVLEKPATPEALPEEKPPRPLIDFEIAEKPADVSTETILDPEPTEPSPPLDLDEAFSDVPEIEEPIEEDIPFILVEQSPRFPGCEEDNEEDYKRCFNQNIKAYIGKKFNADVASSNRGKQRILVQFTIDQNGEIKDVQARASARSLEKEAVRVVKSLPQMIPGEQRGRSVKVKFTVPIAIQIGY